MVIDIHSTMQSLLAALRSFVSWMQNTRISNGSGAGVSIFAIAVTWLVVTVIIEVFIPWAYGGDEDDE